MFASHAPGQWGHKAGASGVRFACVPVHAPWAHACFELGDDLRGDRFVCIELGHHSGPFSTFGLAHASAVCGSYYSDQFNCVNRVFEKIFEAA
jgi:hypothetical protein